MNRIKKLTLPLFAACLCAALIGCSEDKKETKSTAPTAQEQVGKEAAQAVQQPVEQAKEAAVQVEAAAKQAAEATTEAADKAAEASSDAAKKAAEATTEAADKATEATSQAAEKAAEATTEAAAEAPALPLKKKRVSRASWHAHPFFFVRNRPPRSDRGGPTRKLRPASGPLPPARGSVFAAPARQSSPAGHRGGRWGRRAARGP